MSKVWIIKEQVARGPAGPAVMDYSAACEFGDIEFVTQHDMPLYSRSSVQAAWDDSVKKFAAEYNEVHDFIVTTGQPTAIFAAGWVLGLTGKTPRFLVWRREEGRYRVVDFAGTNFHDVQ